ncbi:hypothetical protein ACFX2I_038684 [Malus domestica]
MYARSSFPLQRRGKTDPKSKVMPPGPKTWKISIGFSKATSQYYLLRSSKTLSDLHGDLTGVKKHFCRKHGEKKWKCEQCSKKYAVQSDWKTHMRTCGTREYRCNCGTLFSGRDSFITHMAFFSRLLSSLRRFTNYLHIHRGKAAIFVCHGSVNFVCPYPLSGRSSTWQWHIWAFSSKDGLGSSAFQLKSEEAWMVQIL